MGFFYLGWNCTLKPGFDSERVKCDLEIELCFGRSRKHCGKRRLVTSVFSSPSTKCSEGAILITHRLLASVVRSHFLVYTLASTNINQSAPNLVQMYMTIRSRMSSIMELIGPELSELSALELENLPYLTLFTLASANIDQSVPNLATIYMPTRPRRSLIMGQIEPEHLELFALEFGKIAENYFVYTL